MPIRRKLCPRPVLHFILILILLLFLFCGPHSSRDRDNDPISHLGTLSLVDDVLDEALHVSLSNTQDGRHRTGLRGADAQWHPSQAPRASTYRLPLVNPALQVDLGVLRAQACQILRGKSVFLVGPHETLYQLHSYLLTVLHPDQIVLGKTTAPAMRPSSCPGDTLSNSCPSHPLCHHPTKLPPQSSFHSGSGSVTTFYDYKPPTLQPINSSGILRFLNSGNLNPSSTQEDVLLSVDPRTGVRVIDSRWVRYAASSKADILVLNRGPLPAPAWSYNKSTSPGSNLNLTWLSTLRALEKKHAEPLSDLFADILSRLDDHYDHHLFMLPSLAELEPDNTTMTKLVINAALFSTISTFLPWLLSTLSKLREHVGHHPILGTKKPVLWYGSWFLPVSCTPESLSVFSSESDPRHLLVQLLAQAEEMSNPWSAYYNAQVYIHDRLLARLLPTYGVFYVSSLSTIVPPPEVGQTYDQGERHFFIITFIKDLHSCP